MTRSLAAAVEEHLLVPTYSSQRAFPWITAHRGLSLPIQLIGQARRRTLMFAGRKIQVLEAGREKLITPLCTRLFGDLPRADRHVFRGLWNPATLAAESDADIILAEVHRWMAPRFRRLGWLIVPDSVSWHGALATVPPAKCSQGLLKNLRKVKKQGFEIEPAGATADWDEFYTDMVAPQALARHGPRAWVPSRRLMAELARVGMLHLITRRGQRVAGICTVPRGDTLWLAISGVRHGDPSLLHDGAGFATVALAIEWARAQGYRCLDAGRTVPFVHHGLQQFKRGWGFVPEPNPLAHLAAIRVNSPAVQCAFEREPVLVEDDHGLRTYRGAMTFLSSECQ